MSTVQEIEAALHQLSSVDKWNLLRRFWDELWDEWDQQIEGDVKAGRLDALVSEARAEIAAGKTRPLNEVLAHRKNWLAVLKECPASMDDLPARSREYSKKPRL